MRIATGIEQNRIEIESYLVDFIDQLTFHIALIVVEIHLRKAFLKMLEKILESLASVDFWLPFSQEIEIGAVDDLNFQN